MEIWLCGHLSITSSSSRTDNVLLSSRGAAGTSRDASGCWSKIGHARAPSCSRREPGEAAGPRRGQLVGEERSGLRAGPSLERFGDHEERPPGRVVFPSDALLAERVSVTAFPGRTFTHGHIRLRYLFRARSSLRGNRRVRKPDPRSR